MNSCQYAAPLWFLFFAVSISYFKGLEAQAKLLCKILALVNEHRLLAKINFYIMLSVLYLYQLPLSQV